MTALYWFAMVVGVGMYLFSVFADTSGAEADSDAHIHVGSDHHGADGYQILSIRNATYFLFAFGVTGVALNWMWGGARSWLTAILALGIGTLGASISTLAFGWLRKSESGQMQGDRAWLGATGDVLLPLSVAGTGKVFVSRGGRSQELLARPFDTDATDVEQWTKVVVLEMRDGIALVAPNDELVPGEATPRLGA